MKVGDKIVCIRDNVQPENIGKIFHIYEISRTYDEKCGRAIKTNTGRLLWEFTEVRKLTPLEELL